MSDSHTRIHVNAIHSFEYSTPHTCTHTSAHPPIQTPLAICTCNPPLPPPPPYFSTSLPANLHRPTLPPPPQPHLPPLPQRSRNIKQRLQLLDKRPLLITNVGAIELLERIDRLSRNERVQHVLLFQLAAVHGLVRGFDLHRHGRLALFADGDLFVVALDG